jgi:hypothetical protein
MLQMGKAVQAFAFDGSKMIQGQIEWHSWEYAFRRYAKVEAEVLAVDAVLVTLVKAVLEVAEV